MSYKDRAHDVAETFIENRPDALLKPIMGKLFGGNAPGYLRIPDGFCQIF